MNWVSSGEPFETSIVRPLPVSLGIVGVFYRGLGGKIIIGFMVKDNAFQLSPEEVP